MYNIKTDKSLSRFHVHRKLTASLLSYSGSHKPRPLPIPPLLFPVEVGTATPPQFILSREHIPSNESPLSASDGGRDPIDPVAAGYYDNGSDGSNSVLAFGGLAVGVAVLWLVCRRRKRVSGRRGTILSKLPVV